MKITNLLKGTFFALTAVCLTGLSNCASSGGDPVLEADGRESSFDKEMDYENAVGDEITGPGTLRDVDARVGMDEATELLDR